MTWEQDPRAVAINALIHDWDLVTLLFPPVSLIPLVQVLEQQIVAILICPGWTGALWWPQLVKLRVMAPICLPPAEECIKFPKGSREELPNLDPLYAFHISGKVI